MFADELAAARVPSVRASALGCMSDSHARNGYTGISPQATARDHIDRSSGPW